ncbi:hypothetical protein [Desulfovibrio ferrophilus]|uniref:Uncharacterized protein n=1 Tax=Desulfovibrio ferrophilus TaxID=241368 RepID=A0A2Z6AUA7_9BACT|nr:hypothetical protein [Desulfovibrio ferrophilus]BBD06814.1 putative uncharacterized protein [Desulfovibrio ferrophilus]
MPEYRIAPITVSPKFDATRFIATSHTGELPEETINELSALWDTLTNGIQVKRIDNGTGSWLLIWLEKHIEQQVERCWETSPHRGFLEHALAVDYVMAAAADLIPEIAAHGCAPIPEPSPAVREAAEELGLSWPERHTLNRRYALLTPLPWKGGCSACHLNANCPKHKTPSD